MEAGALHEINEKSEAEKENDCTIDIEAVTKSIKRKVTKHVSPDSSNVCFYRVPATLRKMKPEAYSPTFISIGPFHSGRKGLVGNSYKPIYLRTFLEHTRLTPDTIVKTVESLAGDVRCCYPNQSIKMTSNKFLKLLVLDGCFVVMHLIISASQELQSSSNLGKFWDEISCDLLLLENQLPFFLFESLYELYTFRLPSLQNMSFLELAQRFIKNYVAGECLAGTDEVKVNHFVDEVKVNHFVDVLKLHFTRDVLKLHCTREPCDSDKTFTFQRKLWPPTATALYQCGVIFRKRKKEKKKCAVVFMPSGHLKLPPMTIDDGFETRVRNLMAYEQCHANNNKEGSVVRNFIVFMQFLVQTDQDVKLLTEHGIIENNLGSIKEVTQIFNSVCRNVNLEINYYNKKCKKMQAYCTRRRHLWMTTLRRNYFSTPWTCASSIAAILLLAFTFVQTVGTLVQVKFFRSN